MTTEISGRASDLRNLLKGYNMLLYFAGSMIMHEPTEECVVDFFSDGILKRMPVSSFNPRFVRAAALLRESCSDRELCRKELINDFNRLFSESGMKLALPVRSGFPSANADGSLMGNAAGFYDSYGWRSRPSPKVPDDHLGIELLFLTKLTEKYLQLDDEPCRIEMEKEIRRFINHYIMTWLPEWNVKIQENAQSSVYRGIGNLIQACVEDLDAIFDYRNRPL